MTTKVVFYKFAGRMSVFFSEAAEKRRAMSGGCLQPSTLSAKTDVGRVRRVLAAVHAFHVRKEQ